MNKGFIGSIGDDFPSLIPLFFAVLIFFATLGYAFNMINTKSQHINTYIDSLSIAKAAMGNGTFKDYEQFLSVEKKIKTTSNFIVGLVYLDEKNKENFDVSEINRDLFIQNDNDCFVLTPWDEDSKTIGTCVSGTPMVYSSTSIDLDDEIDILSISKTKNVYKYLYPVSLYTNKGYIVAYLLVVVW